METNKSLKNWRTVSKLSATFLLSIILLASCKKEDSAVGAGINPNGLNLVTIDTFTVMTHSQILDSVTTDETSVSLLGAYNDPEFGIVDCGIATQIRLSSESPSFGNVTSVDSVVLSFVYGSIKYYGNVSDMTFEVFEISDDLIRDDQDYYAFTPINTTGANLVLAGHETLLPKPYNDVVVGDDTLNPQIRLNLEPSFGQTLIDNAAQMTTNTSFTSYFKGLYVKVTNPSTLGSTEGSVLYLSLEDALSKMVLYYTNDATESKTFTFNINSKCARFNKIDYDRAGTDVQNVLDNPENGAEKFYMQSSSIRAIVEFPHIMDLYKDKKRIINKAVLVVPVQDFQPDVFDPTVSLLITKVQTNLISDLILYNPSINSFVSNYDEDNKEFRFILTKEIQGILKGDTQNTGYRIYPSSFFGSSIERIIFSGANSSSKYKTRLEITYTEY
jgi:hypothetical protein